jgi:hypothetical protein
MCLVPGASISEIPILDRLRKLSAGFDGANLRTAADFLIDVVKRIEALEAENTTLRAENTTLQTRRDADLHVKNLTATIIDLTKMREDAERRVRELIAANQRARDLLEDI